MNPERKMARRNAFRTLMPAAWALLGLVFGHNVLAADTLPLTIVADIPLAGNTTRWDYASLDGNNGLLFLAHLGDSVVTVVDTKAQKVVADIPNIAGVHGVLVIPELGRVYASATGSNEVVAIDIKTLKVTARMPAGDYPDGIAYAPEVHKIYVSDEHGGTDTVIDVRTNSRVTTIKVGREVGNTQYDPVSKHIFVNEQTSGELVEIDPAIDKVVNRIKLPGAKGNHGLYIDAPARQAYIACEGNDTLLVLDLNSKKVTASFKVGADPDVLAFDPALDWLYVAGEAGIVSVFKKQDGKLVKLGEGLLGPNAHVVAVDPATHRAYFPLKDVAGKSLLRITAAQSK
ncbi:YncE family protein [Undibacterium sp. Ji50W]|uniref:YncE family protein n=1 Tax=Undibacterium sp. Ji50W TaxID=3413041 RepID=UPI003BF3A2C2